MSILDQMHQRLATLSPLTVEIFDESGKHVGHAGAQGGGGHYELHIISAAFEGKTPLARHRMVYDALGPLMQQQIHALSIRAYTPAEFH